MYNSVWCWCVCSALFWAIVITLSHDLKHKHKYSIILHIQCTYVSYALDICVYLELCVSYIVVVLYSIHPFASSFGSGRISVVWISVRVVVVMWGDEGVVSMYLRVTGLQVLQWPE